MSKRIVSTLCAGLIFLGLSVSVCLGAEDLLQQLKDNRDLTGSSDNKQNLRLMQVIQQYASKINNPNSLEEDSSEDEAGTRRKRSVTMRQQEATKSLPVQKRETEDESFDEFADYGTVKRGASLQKNPLDMGFKNRPGFRSWGGKRSKYVSWDGKRFLPSVRRIRKSKFNNWGGKRSATDDFDEFERWNKEKRDTFRSWGGKRAVFVPPTLRTGYDSPSKFSNWGGKRFDLEDYRAGKRDLEYPMPYEQEEENEIEGKRGQFQSWGGKRFDRTEDGFIGEKSGNVAGLNWILRQYINNILHLLQNDRRIGKKNIFGSKPLEDEEDLSTSGFSAWRGRR